MREDHQHRNTQSSVWFRQRFDAQTDLVSMAFAALQKCSRLLRDNQDENCATIRMRK